ncbi:MAG TPA: tetratricopeptide repeat protein [Methylomirabilota bacterium]|jgi:Flp pilus assembly protein TadD|nr:tetratricopeptide repeat protein [Methylomirabilota bacterium]
MSDAARPPFRLSPALLALAIFGLTVVVFLPALGNGFVDWDDELNFTTNPHYRGLGWAQLRWMLTSAPVWGGHWIPLTWLSFAVDYVLWGMNPLGYHLTNVLLHGVDAALFFFVARRLLGLGAPAAEESHLRLGAVAAALFWALHPLRAESVAWATERRDVLSALFFLLSILAYLRMAAAPAAPGGRWLAASVAAFGAALLSKPIVMTLPLVLVVLDVYPLRRLSVRPREWLAPAARRVWLEKLPYLALAGAGAAISFVITVSAMPLVSVAEYPLTARLAMLVNSLAFYVGKTLLPLGLLPVHELPPRVSLTDPPFMAAAAFSIVVTVALVVLRRRWAAPLAAWTVYAIMLLPVSGLLINIDPQIVADRYSYLSCLGFAVVAGAGVAVIARAVTAGAVRSGIGRFAAAIGALWLIALAALTWQQAQVWRDSAALWGHAVAVSPECGLCENRLGAALFNRRQLAPAVVHLERAVALRPDRPSFRRELGVALLWTHQAADALPHLRVALDRAPADPDLRSTFALALLWAGQTRAAETEFREVVARKPNHPDALTGLGMALVALGRPAESVELLERAVALRPRAALARYGLARAYLALGRRDAAEAQAAILRAVEPALAEQALQR